MNSSCLVVLHFNKTNQTIKCIQSIIDSGYRKNQILAFDNGSSIENFNLIKNSFPDIRHKRIETNKGFSGGFNAAIRWAIEEGFSNFLFCSNDTIIFQNALASCLDASEKHNATLVAPKIVYSSRPEEIDSIGGNFNYSSFSLNHYKKNDLPVELNPETDYVPGTCFWLEKGIFLSLGGMDESFHTYWEDADFSFRAHKNGFKSIRCYESEVSHGVGKTCHKKPLYSTYYFQRNRIRFCRKYCSSDQLNKARQIIKNDLSGLELKSKKANDIVRLNYLKELCLELDIL